MHQTEAGDSYETRFLDDSSARFVRDICDGGLPGPQRAIDKDGKAADDCEH